MGLIAALAVLIMFPALVTADVFAASSGAAAPSGKVIPLIRPADGREFPAGEMHKAPRILRQASRRNLLGLERENEFGLPKTTLQAGQVLKLLAIRVEFIPEDPDDPTTTGDGTFDLRDSVQFKNEHGHLFDATPHDSAYFGKHIEALSHYWHTVSNGKISIAGTVYPPDGQPAYTLPNSMAHYGEQLPQYGLTEFYFDAIQVADTTNPEINFADYDAYCVVHAGSDKQSDWMWDTPNDLYTGFILLGAPIYVDHGTHIVTEGMIMPETVNQDNRIVVLNAVMAHEFGHQLGLVDWYSTETFITQIGNFSLMDNNAANIGGEIEAGGRTRLLFGSLPVFPDAWSRAFLGMVGIDTVETDPEAYVYAAELDDEAPQAVLVPITRGEYFLIENRRINIDEDPITAILADSTTNVILGPVDSDRNFSREYDYLLPGNGILIWHVDELVAFEDEIPDDDVPNNYVANTLQWNFDRRFLSLVEADMNVSFRGSEYDNFGTYTDMFSAPERHIFSPQTPIATVANSGARTGITITVRSSADLVMVFSVENDQTLPGFPVWCGAGPEYSSPSIIDIDSDDSPEIIVGSGARIFGWHFDGTPIYDNGIFDTIVSLNGDVFPQRAAVMAEMSAPLLGPPLVSFIDGIDHANVVAIDWDNTINIWRLTDFDQDQYADALFAGVAENALGGPTIVFERPGSFIREVAFALDDGGLMTVSGHARDSTFDFNVGRIISMAGTTAEDAYCLTLGGFGTWYVRSLTDAGRLAVLDADTVYGPVIGDLDRDDGLDIICAGAGGTVWAFDSLLNLLPGFPAAVSGEIYADPVLGDIDRDGYLEIVLTGDNLVYALNYNGTSAEDFPVLVDRHHPCGPVNSSPIIVSPSGNRPVEIMVSTADGELVSVGRREFDQPDFISRKVGAPVIGSPAFAYDAASETSAVFAVGSDGFLYGFALPWDAGPYHGMFNQRNYEGGRNNVFPLDSLPDRVEPEGILAESSVYAYPNPADGDEVYLRYQTGVEAEIDVAIYDVAGNLIDRLEGTGMENTDNEIVWQCGDVASGVYFCRMVVRSATGESKTVFCPVAIAR